MDNDAVLNQVLEILNQRNADPVSATAADQTLDELGVDSIDLVQILATFERTSDVQFLDSDFDLDQYETLTDVATVIHDRSHD